MGEILVKALKDPSYTMIFLGFFSCGYQLAFVTAHFPAFVTELCGPIMPGGALHSIGITTTSLGAVAISLIGSPTSLVHCWRVSGKTLYQKISA